MAGLCKGGNEPPGSLKASRDEASTELGGNEPPGSLKSISYYLGLVVLWSVALYGAETWTLRRSEAKRLDAFEMWIWRRMKRVKWTMKMCKKVGEQKIM
ncbi:hypothetical protein ANN_24366 [Periplaneta americana]|uniref:Uncharacterized protein n=1 Tax=Periplaneta americana TaxID=6978 RepID=A0ABQ8S374_PERAM|nr:hypothetical protein ANN_24366 [Periplaneta americana]